MVNLSGSLVLLCEEMAKQSEAIAILTDLDQEGKSLYAKLRTALSSQGVRIDDRLRNALFRNSSLTHIEGLASYVARRRPSVEP